MLDGMSEPPRDTPVGQPIRISILVSGHGRGSNMQALMDGCSDGRIAGEVALVIGTRDGAPAIERARRAGIATLVLRPDRAAGSDVYARRLLEALKRVETDLICLAGYMRLLPGEVVEAYRWRIMNVHPALLPAYGGKGMYGEAVHRAVLASGDAESGCTVHFADDRYDHGPIILQTRVPVVAGDTPETLAARVLPHEHETYVRAVALFAAGRLTVRGERVEIAEGD